MKISYNWLKNYLDIDLPSDQVAVLLTDIGLEVEAIELVESIKGGLKGVVIGEVLTKSPHPNADRLNITTVDIGGNEPLQIVCGAPNVDAGQKVPVATVGTWIYDGDNKFKIKKSKIRGEVSEGMICGEDELGLGGTTDGIMVLDTIAEVGMLASDYFKLETDTVFDIGLTPNRSDAMGHIGVARDLMTVLNYKGSKLEVCKPSVADFKIVTKDKNIEVDIRDSDLCLRYSGVSISDIVVADSPQWLQNRLNSIGITPTNNVVDITNYVLHETGQPLHAFDIAKIEGRKIVVSTIADNTKFTTLDEVERNISDGDLMISSAKKPLCIAGVYGGLESGVGEKTVDIFLESAYFNPVSIRKTAKLHNLNTDASFRFERGCDPDITVYALKRAALLISKICGGNIASDIIDVYPKKINHHSVNLSYSKIDEVIGEVIDRKIIKSILIDLGIDIQKEISDGLSLLVPLFKTDVKREVDIIEEILRIYGFNTVLIPEKLNTSIIQYNEINTERTRNIISDLLANNGFNETMNNSLTKSSYTALISELDEKQNVVMLNPLSQDLDVMRQSLLFSGLENIIYNQNRKNSNLKFYEFGRTYHKTEKGNIEKQHLQILITGRIQHENWYANDNKTDFYFLKKNVEHVLSRLGINDFKLSEGSGWGRSYSLTYNYKDKRLVCFGKVTEDLCVKFGIKTDVYMADFDWDSILEFADQREVKYKDISKFPYVRRDLSLLIDNTVSFSEIKDIAKQADNKILRSINLFDVYEGAELPEGKKSYAVSFIMADYNKTLTDKYIDKVMDKLINSFKKKLGADIR